VKYLKSYKIFESVDSIETEVKDILSELEDSGHDLHTNLFDFKEYYRLDVFINFSPSVYISEFKDSIDHLLSKLESEDWRISSQWSIEDVEDQNPLPWKPSGAIRLDGLSDNIKIKIIELRFDKFK
jgi:hypothetical protein